MHGGLKNKLFSDVARGIDHNKLTLRRIAETGGVACTVNAAAVRRGLASFILIHDAVCAVTIMRVGVVSK